MKTSSCHHCEGHCGSGGVLKVIMSVVACSLIWTRSQGVFWSVGFSHCDCSLFYWDNRIVPAMCRAFSEVSEGMQCSHMHGQGGKCHCAECKDLTCWVSKGFFKVIPTVIGKTCYKANKTTPGELKVVYGRHHQSAPFHFSYCWDKCGLCSAVDTLLVQEEIIV